MQAERDADDGDAVDNTGNEVARSHGEAGAEQPNDVGDERGRAAAVFDALAKGCERERGHLEGLAPQRNTDDGDAEQASDAEPVERGEDSAKEHPDNVADKSHGSSDPAVSEPASIVRCRQDKAAYGQLKVGWVGLLLGGSRSTRSVSPVTSCCGSREKQALSRQGASAPKPRERRTL